MKKLYPHLMVGGLVILLSVILERAVYMNYDLLEKSPVILNDYMAIAPVYNTAGSWLHGRWDIGYNMLLLGMENLAAFLMAVYLLRFMDVMMRFFQTPGGRVWLYAVDMEAAVMLYRLIARIYSPYTLDYLYIRGSGTYDFPDFCIGTGIAVILLWTVLEMVQYYSFKKKQTVGMTFWAKLKWEMGISLMFMKAALLPEGRWESKFAPWKGLERSET